MIPKRNNPLRISKEPLDFAASVEMPDVVQSESPVHNMRDEGRSIFDKNSETTSTDMDHSSAAIEAPSLYPPEPSAVVHHPQIIDSDVEDFTCKLDTMIAQFRNESVKEFLTMKRHILHEQITTIENEKKRCNALLSAKQDEIEHLKEQLAGMTGNRDQYDLQRNSLAVSLGVEKKLKYGQKISARALRGWLQHHADAQHAKRQNAMVKGIASRVVKTRIFRALKAHWAPIHAQKEAARFESRVAEEKSKLSMTLNKEIQDLTFRLDETQTQLQAELDSKTSIQGNLKKAFMRGVCAMNFEAMNILDPATGLVPENFDMTSLGGVDDSMQQATPPQAMQQTMPPQSMQQMTPQAVRQTPQPTVVANRTMPASPSPVVVSHRPMVMPQVQDQSHVDESGQPLTEIVNRIPSESKENKWKPAPVIGRPQTATPLISDAASTLPSILPGNAPEPSGAEGKTIRVNQGKSYRENSEPRVVVSKNAIPVRTVKKTTVKK